MLIIARQRFRSFRADNSGNTGTVFTLVLTTNDVENPRCLMRAVVQLLRGWCTANPEFV